MAKVTTKATAATASAIDKIAELQIKALAIQEEITSLKTKVLAEALAEGNSLYSNSHKAILYKATEPKAVLDVKTWEASRPKEYAAILSTFNKTKAGRDAYISIQ